MKLHYSLVFGLLVILIFHPYSLSGQSSDPNQQQNYLGFDSLGWHRISKRYERVQPRAELSLKNGETLSGQVLLLSDSNLVLYPGYEIVFLPDQSKQFIYVDLKDIESIKFRDNNKNYGGLVFGGLVGGAVGLFGGAIILWGELPVLIIPFTAGGASVGGLAGRKIHQKSKSYSFENDTTRKKEHISSMRKWVVYEDAIKYADSFNVLVDHSKIMQKAFPENRIKLEFSMNPSGKGYNIKHNIEDVIGSGYPTYNNSYKYIFSDFSINTSVKVIDRFYLGVGWFKGNVNKTFRYYLADTLSYNIDPWALKGFNVFGEYSIIPVDRFKTKRLEVQGGLGLIFAKNNVNIWWRTGPVSGGTWNGGEMDLHDVNILGMLGKVSANLYFSPSFSFTAGIEGNFFRNLKVPALERLDMNNYDWPAIEFPIPEYNINYTTIRFRIGTQFHF